MKGRNNTWTDMAAAAAFAAVLGISAFWGQHDRAYDQAGTAGSAYGRMYNQAGPADEDGGPVGKAGAYPGTAGAAQAAEGAGEDLARTGGKDAENPSGCDRIPEGGSGQNHKCIRDAGFGDCRPGHGQR